MFLLSGLFMNEYNETEETHEFAGLTCSNSEAGSDNSRGPPTPPDPAHFKFCSIEHTVLLATVSMSDLNTPAAASPPFARRITSSHTFYLVKFLFAYLNYFKMVCTGPNISSAHHTQMEGKKLKI